ncbi:tRNA (guanine-N(7)-)-methyltransferase non-catalytic subunit WDR4 isoform X2 [Spea bombifrons]|uniref:tRNA (guanine-N(7)-)-methyltransferase non-catalytic subunit WDR4 isoform X2 n=1 Tax=Spea bombifrons TaxID=233779 RepID=UPI00234B69C1|nr:tRNA (guanine-N(7)-)-methyltransferase non-catalytic subunit WDR4 isoform X2 [Spea bombifrons]
MLRLRAGWLSVIGGSILLSDSARDPSGSFLFDSSSLEKPIPTPGQDSSVDPPTGSDRILAASFSPAGDYFALTDDSKRLVLFQTNPTWEKISTRGVSRRCTALTFSACGKRVLVADKSGDVFSFSVTRAQEEGRLELGHLSMLLDVVVSDEGDYVITCDRDEKIRVSAWNSPHVIAAFCLGHREFVSKLLVLPGPRKLLLSGSGDGSVRLWEYETGREVHSISLSAACGAPESQRLAVSRISCCPRGEHVAVLCDRVCGFYVFSVSSVPRLETPRFVSVASTPLDLDFDDSSSLWVLCRDAERPLVCYGQIDGRWQPVPEDPSMKRHSEAIRKNWERLEGPETPESPFTSLYKAVCDNMSSYLRKKEARIEAEKRKVPKPVRAQPGH